MSELDYGVSYIASAPEELNVGDRVIVTNGADDFYGERGTIVSILMDGGITIQFDNRAKGIYEKEDIRKLPDPIYFEEESDNVKEFRAILNEMAETYKTKDATYGNCYQDGFTRFGAVQLVSRMYEKYCRIENLLVRNADNKVPDESVLDTWTDIAVQSVVLRMLLQKNYFDNVD